MTACRILTKRRTLTTFDEPMKPLLPARSTRRGEYRQRGQRGRSQTRPVTSDSSALTSAPARPSRRGRALLDALSSNLELVAAEAMNQSSPRGRGRDSFPSLGAEANGRSVRPTARSTLRQHWGAAVADWCSANATASRRTAGCRGGATVSLSVRRTESRCLAAPAWEWAGGGSGVTLASAPMLRGRTVGGPRRVW
jgi:hypothetical protein